MVRRVLLISALLLVPAAVADTHLGDPLSVSGVAGPELGGTVWGTNAGQGIHPYGTQGQVYVDAVFGPPFIVTVSSGPEFANRLGGQMNIDFSAFAPADFSTHEVFIENIKPPGTPGGPVISVTSSVGIAEIIGGGSGVKITASGAALAAAGRMNITWEQIPEPATLGLLALGALALIRRR